MRRRDRLLAVTVVLLLIAGFRVGQQVYRWYVYADERAEIGRVEVELQEAGRGVVRTQIAADSVRIRIEEIDRELAARRVQLGRHERQLLSSRSSDVAATTYRSEFRDYNERVAARNELFREWGSIIGANHEHVARYNLMVDSVRALAASMGELYYPVLSPAEIAERDGLLGENGEAETF
ncbi:MAG: hypothetical protein WD766_12920 [Gemmatimonadota bacterium]